MAIPALRQPKIINTLQDSPKTASDQNVVVTLKDNKKLVVSSDAYQGIITSYKMYKCILCTTDMQLDPTYKDYHIETARHKEYLKSYPHVDEYGENLIRKISVCLYYCTICNVSVASMFLKRHLAGHRHTTELDKAIIRGTAYQEE